MEPDLFRLHYVFDGTNHRQFKNNTCRDECPLYTVDVLHSGEIQLKTKSHSDKLIAEVEGEDVTFFGEDHSSQCQPIKKWLLDPKDVNGELVGEQNKFPNNSKIMLVDGKLYYWRRICYERIDVSNVSLGVVAIT